jgi:hypothetical protein
VDEELISKVTVAGTKLGTSEPKGWDWRKDLFEIVKKISGVRKLEFMRPSTAPIGNLGIMAAVTRIAEVSDLGSHLTCKLFMGKAFSAAMKSKIQVPISVRDTDHDILEQ